jgi:hypothetical protein
MSLTGRVYSVHEAVFRSTTHIPGWLPGKVLTPPMRINLSPQTVDVCEYRGNIPSTCNSLHISPSRLKHQVSLSGSTSWPSPPDTTMVCLRHTDALWENLAHGQSFWRSTSLQLTVTSEAFTVHTTISPNTCVKWKRALRRNTQLENGTWDRT